MNTKSLILALALVLATITAAAASMSSHSPMGYTIQLPQDWVTMNQKEMRSNPAVVEAALKKAQDQQGLTAIPKQLLAKVKSLLSEGQLDLYLSPSPRYTISVIKGVGSLADKDGKSVCQGLAKAISEQAGRDVLVHECREEPVDGHRGVYVVADDYWKGKKYIQYQVQLNDDEVLFFTANTRDRNFDEMKDEFRQVMSSLKIDDQK